MTDRWVVGGLTDARADVTVGRADEAQTLVFVNYRSSDAASAAALVHAAMSDRFGSETVFLDYESLPLGCDFEPALLARLRTSAVVLVVVGERWLAGEIGQRAIDNPDDWVRREILEALAHDIPVVPVLFPGAVLDADRLPEELAVLARLQRHEVHRLQLSDIDVLGERLANQIPRLAGRQVGRSDHAPGTTSNVAVGVAGNVVQAGSIGQVFLGGSGDGALELDIPALDTVESLLSFANTTIEYVGRAGELDELKGFLAAETPFSWWLWTGPAGIGKSRLAVELCRFASEMDWQAGFLRETDQTSLGQLRAQRPTLVVVDYAAQRSQWLSEALDLLSRRHHQSRVRILVLERDTFGEWWRVAQRMNRMEESYRISAAMYAKPRPMSGLDREDARTLVRNTAKRLDGAALTAGKTESIVDRAAEMDPVLRPLFVQIATIDKLGPSEERPSRDDALRRIIARTTARLDAQVASPPAVRLARNLHFFTTAVGGLTVADYESLHPLPDPVKDLLPGIFQHLGPSVTVGDLVDGVRPDIVGELFVLDQLGAEPTVALASDRLLGYAARTRPDAYRGFVERAVADHADHPQLLNLLTANRDGRSAAADLHLAVAVIPLLGRSDHPVIEWIFDQLHITDTAEGRVDQVRHLTATARFRFANLVRAEDDPQRAHDLYTEALADCDPTWPEYDSILNNRGIALLDLERAEAARGDFTAVIESKFASAEMRACALNNRADILHEQGDLDGAIADRSAVLDLASTSYDRRYIALIRRARALRKQGNNAGAYDDITRILDTDDIAIEQKMEAKLIRAEWALDDGDPVSARADLDEIAASYRNFDDVEKKVEELRRRLGPAARANGDA